MNRALLVLLAVASLAGCSDSTGPVSTEPISFNPRKLEEVLIITNSSSDPVYYHYYVGDASNTLFAICLDPKTCDSIPAHSSVAVRYADIPKANPGIVPIVTFTYWRLTPSVDNSYRADSVRYAFARLQ